MFHFSLAFSLSSVCYFMCNGDPGGGDLGKELDWNCEVAFNKQAEQVIWVIQFRLHCETVVFRYWSIKFVSAGFRFRLFLQNDALWVISASANTKSSNSLIGRHLKEYGVENPRLTDNFSFLKKWRNRFECLYKNTTWHHWTCNRNRFA